MNVRFVLPIVMIASPLLLAGCGGERSLSTPKTHPVKGVVTVNGTPVAGVYFDLQPVGTGGVPARATTDDDGNFELRTFSNGDDPDGAVPGEYVVEFLLGNKALPSNINERQVKVQIKGDEGDLRIDIEP